jgi:hypothetical protein
MRGQLQNCFETVTARLGAFSKLSYCVQAHCSTFRALPSSLLEKGSSDFVVMMSDSGGDIAAPCALVAACLEGFLAFFFRNTSLPSAQIVDLDRHSGLR